MKKTALIFLSFFFFTLLVQIAKADILPYYTHSLRRYGIGFTSVSSPLVMYQTPSEDGKILETLNFDYKGNATCSINPNKCSIDEIFATYSQDKKLALLTTLDETEGWSLVCFNQAELPTCGWVNEKENKFYNWTTFFDYFGKKNGIYLFKDLKKEDKRLYSAPIKQTNVVGTIELPRYISPWLVRGNWILVKVSDINKEQKTGWLNFRGNDGKLKVFVNF